MKFDAVHFQWPAGPTILTDFSLDIHRGSITAIVGASGSGKSTILRLAAGLLSPGQGDIRGVPDAGLAFVFQSPNLLPWMSLRDNVALPLTLQRLPPADRRTRADGALAEADLSDVADQLPQALSGGMQMRASLARALITRPELLLMDEPFSALDALTRRRMRAWFLSIWQQTRQTVLMVTHDLEEAILLSDRVVVVAERPLVIAHDQAVTLPRPRDRHDPELIAMVHTLEGALEVPR
ncbi:MAG: ABC transporter ATP-binding protein [Myxococcota bacterium]